MTVFPVKTVVLHEGPHVEELVALILARWRGSKSWPGISRARIATMDGSKPVDRTALWRLQNRQELCIGCGGGRFDEHGGNDEGVLCSADLVARFLRIDQYRRVEPLLRFLRREDVGITDQPKRTGSTATPLDIAQCVKLFNFMGWQPFRIEQWLSAFLFPYLTKEGTEFPVKEDQHRNLLDLFKRWLVKKGFIKSDGQISDCSHRPELKQLCKWIQNLAKRPPSLMFDLAEGVALQNACYRNQEAAYCWVSVVFEAKLAEQKEFVRAVDIVKQGDTIWVGEGENRLRFLFVQSDNRCIVKAAQMLDPKPNVVVIQWESGNTQIMMLRSPVNPLSMILRALRFEEQRYNRIPADMMVIGFDELAAAGTIDGAEAWYFYTNGNGHGRAIFNGSFSRPKVEPTQISWERMREVIIAAAPLEETSESWTRLMATKLNR